MEQIEQLTQWLETHKGSTLQIRKEELATGLQHISDIDQVTLNLDHISLVTNEGSIDDYIPGNELILHGEGTIQSTEGTANLPQNAYEIPLTGNVTTSKGTSGLKVETEKAIYNIIKTI
ncbi:hypothetical protein [Halalkalibacter krulwichiae]|uniref:Uncharacterized protein n=1 Tax=Halalkalibacter krulwichiae TaxID=199441 RepID=A0A1X9M7B8_9BACI|nr:hypothetical protein [Halalkalibacter krulwichiae]ARK29319.1 hypothetical protein BkAM31D_05305 [Halalkalibacter krulwichiae]